MPGWALLCIGSAGESQGGTDKAADDKNPGGAKGYLSTAKDIEDCEEWFKRHKSGSHLFGSFNNRGACIDAAFVREQIRKLLVHCRETDSGPLIYYTGHGYAGTGNWAVNGSVTFEQVEQVIRSEKCGKIPVIYSDCCYSGHWVTKADNSSTQICVISAASTSRPAKNRVFARAMFKEESSARKVLDSCAAMATNYRGTTQFYHKGEFESTPAHIKDMYSY